MSKLEDRRKEARELVVSFTLVYESTAGKLLGYLRDLNLGGAQVSGNKSLIVDTEVTLEIELPIELPIAERLLRINARVARCTQVTETPPSYEIGFAFVDIQPQQKALIENFLQRYYFRHF
jgi:hypothetical protein